MRNARPVHPHGTHPRLVLAYASPSPKRVLSTADRRARRLRFVAMTGAVLPVVALGARLLRDWNTGLALALAVGTMALAAETGWFGSRLLLTMRRREIDGLWCRAAIAGTLIALLVVLCGVLLPFSS